ncbi:EAL and HDOD domain-containing protein [Litoribacillus peritrichatus]|uniref:HDOD domain-containing protein n=1 Tax=Litoribacillus peritrichatus TaxID=718191 RepID=A0ABP7MDR4_9GAMM
MDNELSEKKPLLARQPIFDSGLAVAAYELLFRNSETNEANVIDGEDSATSQVLLSAFSENDISQLTGVVPGFVNFTKNLLLSDVPFDKKGLVIEVLEDITDSNEVILAITELKNQGYTIALDDFVYSPDKTELIKLCDIIKVDLMAYPDRKAFLADVKKIQRTRKRLLAEKIETHEEFELCKALGFELFQGYFFAKPQLIKGKRLSYNKQVVLTLIAQFQSPDVKWSDLESALLKDPELTFKLLKLVNSAAYSKGRKVTSVKQALTWLGLKKIKSWVILLSLSNLDDKPKELTAVALVRAKTCELLSKKFDSIDSDIFFTVGMLSCLPAFMDVPMKLLLEKLPLSEEVVQALLHYKGHLGIVLAAVLAHENGLWDKINWKLLKTMQIHDQDINTFYRTAVTWSNEYIHDV